MISPTTDAVEVVCNSITNSTISETQLHQLCTALGLKVRKEFEEKSASNTESRLDDIYADSYRNLWEVLPNSTWKYFISAISPKQ